MIVTPPDANETHSWASVRVKKKKKKNETRQEVRQQEKNNSTRREKNILCNWVKQKQNKKNERDFGRGGLSNRRKREMNGWNSRSSKEENEYEAKRQEVLKELKDNMRPEFLNRIDHIIVFNALNQQHIRKIVRHNLEKLRIRLKAQGYELVIEPKAIVILAEAGFDPAYGARPVRRVIQERIEDEIAEHILKGIFSPGDTIKIVGKKGDKIDLMGNQAA